MATLQFTEAQARQLEAVYSTADVRAQRAETLRLLGLTPGEAVIDVGCGPGFLCESIADLVGAKGHVVGIDVSPDLVELARRRNQRTWLSYEHGDAMALSAPGIGRSTSPSARRCWSTFPTPIVGLRSCTGC